MRTAVHQRFFRVAVATVSIASLVKVAGVWLVAERLAKSREQLIEDALNISDSSYTIELQDPESEFAYAEAIVVDDRKRLRALLGTFGIIPRLLESEYRNIIIASSGYHEFAEKKTGDLFGISVPSRKSGWYITAVVCEDGSECYVAVWPEGL